MCRSRSATVSGDGKLNPRARLRPRSDHEVNGEARRSSELSRHAKTKTDGEFTPALCAWIIHAPPGLSPGWTAAVLLSSVSFRGRPSATGDDGARGEKKDGERRNKKKERAEKDDSKASRSLNEENGPTIESAPAEPILNTCVFLFWRRYYAASRRRVTFEERRREMTFGCWRTFECDGVSVRDACQYSSAKEFRSRQLQQ